MADLDHDIFGQGYRLVTNRLKPKTQLDDESQVEIAKELFPQVEVTWGEPLASLTHPPPFVEEELTTATVRLKNGKAAGHDNILPEIANPVANHKRELS